MNTVLLVVGSFQLGCCVALFLIWLAEFRSKIKWNSIIEWNDSRLLAILVGTIGALVFIAGGLGMW